MAISRRYLTASMLKEGVSTCSDHDGHKVMRAPRALLNNSRTQLHTRHTPEWHVELRIVHRVRRAPRASASSRLLERKCFEEHRETEERRAERKNSPAKKLGCPLRRNRSSHPTPARKNKKRSRSSFDISVYSSLSNSCLNIHPVSVFSQIHGESHTLHLHTAIFPGTSTGTR